MGGMSGQLQLGLRDVGPPGGLQGGLHPRIVGEVQDPPAKCDGDLALSLNGQTRQRQLEFLVIGDRHGG
jgi:hypothetical protein